MFSYQMMFYFILLLLNNPAAAVHQFNLPFVDSEISALLVVMVPSFIFIIKRKPAVLINRLDLTSLIILLLLSFFVFAPLIAPSNPDFQKDIGVTKLLPPLCTKEVIHLKKEKPSSTGILNKFVILKNKIVKRSFDDYIIYADSIKENSEIIYYSKNREYELKRSLVIIKENKPYIESKLYLLGTDEFGRDIFSRLIYGARISLFVGLGAVVVSLIFGLILGFAAGYAGGLTDSLLSRFSDMLLAFPIIFLIILIVAFFGNSLLTIIFVLGFSGWMSLFRIVRGEVITIKNKDYFITARLIGLSKGDLLVKEILPVIAAPIVVNLVFQYGNVILAEAALSFLGLGTGLAYPSWGAMINEGQNYITKAWWMIFFPGLALFLTLLTANNLGKKVNIFFNPRLKI